MQMLTYNILLNKPWIFKKMNLPYLCQKKKVTQLQKFQVSPEERGSTKPWQRQIHLKQAQNGTVLVSHGNYSVTMTNQSLTFMQFCLSPFCVSVYLSKGVLALWITTLFCTEMEQNKYINSVFVSFCTPGKGLKFGDNICAREATTAAQRKLWNGLKI